MDFSDTTTIVLTVAILAFAGGVHGVLGMGFPMIATPLIAMLSDMRTAMILLLVPTMCNNIVNIVKGGHWEESIKKYWPLAAYGTVGSVVGTRLLIVTDPAPYKLLLAAVILLYLNADRFGMRMAWVRQKPTLAYAVFGLAGGILAGTVNVMLPALIIFALELGLAPTAMVQTFNFCFLFGKAAQMIVFAGAGVFTLATFVVTLPLAGVAVGAGLVGMAVRDRVDADTYRGWLRLVLYGMSGMLVLQYFLAGNSM